MKKRILFSAGIVFLLLFIISLLAIVLQLFGSSNPLSRFSQDDPPYNHIEAYDPSLLRLNSIKKLEQFCDSIYGEKIPAGTPAKFETTYTEIVSSTVRNRFYHGYSYFGLDNNYVGTIASGIMMPGLNALVKPDDILKYPYAACSQQSIVMMELLKDKGFATRKITFKGKTFGHFAFEVFYDGAWHFHDPNMEPDKEVLNAYGRPGIDFLSRNPEILVKAYNRHPREIVLDIFPNYSYGPVNQFPAPRALVFQQVTKFLSYTIWVFFLAAFLIVRRKYLRLNSVRPQNRTNASIPRMQPEGASANYYPDYATQGN